MVLEQNRLRKKPQRKTVPWFRKNPAEKTGSEKKGPSALVALAPPAPTWDSTPPREPARLQASMENIGGVTASKAVDQVAGYVKAVASAAENKKFVLVYLTYRVLMVYLNLITDVSPGWVGFGHLPGPQPLPLHHPDSLRKTLAVVHHHPLLPGGAWWHRMGLPRNPAHGPYLQCHQQENGGAHPPSQPDRALPTISLGVKVSLEQKWQKNNQK